MTQSLKLLTISCIQHYIDLSLLVIAYPTYPFEKMFNILADFSSIFVVRRLPIAYPRTYPNLPIEVVCIQRNSL
jgi:hypothetical protein